MYFLLCIFSSPYTGYGGVVINQPAWVILPRPEVTL
jgi:hypothetical protein